ncbi:DNA damage-regulated autophagy modulator protein 1-like [Corticium candelabrum]|uniref:DNA damage-regulated autophagy modulator protein 1-like n=1 Tax=Corticium candelabrum TaxID=121492 RepID=UPI002E257321|nr:DNA damage-regulated autophagy modulator protein 1-like [Corticium candelabrum]
MSCESGSSADITLERRPMSLCCSAPGPECLPVLFAFVMSTAFILSYVLAIARKDVSAGFPYISDTGATPPESCVFTFLLNVGAFIAFVMIYVRYKQVKEYNKQDLSRILRLNTWSAVVGAIAVVGLMLVASFQDINVFVVHVIGAVMTFVFGVMYEWMQAAMTYKMFHNRGQKRVTIIRIVIATLSTVFLITCGITGVIAVNELHTHQKHVTVTDVVKWNSSMPGYETHIVSTTTEWAVAICLLVYFLTFYNAFKKISLEAVVRLRLNNYTMIEDTRETQYLDPERYKGGLY